MNSALITSIIAVGLLAGCAQHSSHNSASPTSGASIAGSAFKHHHNYSYAVLQSASPQGQGSWQLKPNVETPINVVTGSQTLDIVFRPYHSCKSTEIVQLNVDIKANTAYALQFSESAAKTDIWLQNLSSNQMVGSAISVNFRDNNCGDDAIR